MIGETLGKYRIVEQIGRGGMAMVYRAYHPGLDRYVAIKLMHSFLADEEGFLDRFRREAQSVARLRHPNIVHMYDFDVQGDTYYMVMEFLEGASLKHHLADLESRGEWPTLEQAVRIVHDVGAALDYAHRHGMVHRDVKPANIMLTGDGGAILTDFGIVKMLSGSTQLTASGAMIGTPAYMAPEQSTGAVGDERADIYSLGIVLYQLVTGRLPYDADTPMAIVLKHLNDPLPIPRSVKPDLPEGVERVILKALAKDPDDRYQSVSDMLTHLDKAMQGRPVPAVDPSITMAQYVAAEVAPPTDADLSTPIPAARSDVAAPAAPSGRRVPTWVLGLAGLVLIGAVVGGWALLGGNGKPTPTPAPTTAVAMVALGSTATPTQTSTPMPTNTPDAEATNSAATLIAAALTVGAPTPTRTPTPTPTNTPTPTDTPIPTDTPDLTAIAYAACVFDATLEEHVTLSPGQYLTPGTTLEKTWRLSNTGDCAWPPGTVLAFVGGDRMGADDSIEVEPLAPGETAELGPDISLPVANGFYTSTWQLETADGEPFGEVLPIEVNVGPTPTPRPTSTPRPTNTPLATATPLGPLEMSVPSILPGSCWLDPNTGRWGATLVWSASGGTGTYEYYAEDFKPEFKLPAPSYDFSSQVHHRWPGSLYTVSGGEVVKQDRWVEPSECGY